MSSADFPRENIGSFFTQAIDEKIDFPVETVPWEYSP